ncbi:hypothetical protein NDU88_003856, partial [Pleurodeles waltl]
RVAPHAAASHPGRSPSHARHLLRHHGSRLDCVCLQTPATTAPPRASAQPGAAECA